MLAGDLADPMVGRDVLLGVLAGAVMASFVLCRVWVVSRTLGWGVPLKAMPPVIFEGWRGLLYGLQYTISNAVVVPIASTVFVVLLATVLRRRWLAGLAFWCLWTLVILVRVPPTVPIVLLSLAASGVWTLALVRGGLLTAVVTQLTLFFAFHYPWTLDPSAWYLLATVVAVGSVLALAIYGAVTAVGGRAALAGWLPEER